MLLTQTQKCADAEINKLNAYLRQLKIEKERSSQSLENTLPKSLAHKIKIVKESIDKSWKAP